MSEEKIDHLKSSELFRDLSAAEMAELDRVTTMTKCESRRILYTPGETGEALFVLKKGRVQLYRLSVEGKKLVLATLEDDAVFGEMALAGQRMQNTFAEALEPSTLCVMTRREVEWLVTRFPQVSLRLLEIIGHRLIQAEAQLEGFAFKNISARLAALLLRLQRDQIVEGYTHQDLAEMLGAYRETATQTLNEFKTQGLVRLQRKRIEIRDATRLRVLAES
ncbi:MAG: Crp/Fnr family transcriptional regulator [Chloroflexi bacterium]|nr:Crp/Fnr family transcriptional regulator [Chloroflexota bacterium]